MTAREAAIAAVLADRVSDHPMWDGIDYTGEREAKIAAFVYDTAAAIIAALDTTTATETGTYPCCSECNPGCSGRHESRCHCQTAELLAIADEGAARARGEGL